MYDRLTPAERLPLLLSAMARKDDTEFERLRTAAPMQPVQLCHHFAYTQTMAYLSTLFVLEQLSHAANYLHAVWRLEDPNDEHPEPWLLCAYSSAYCFTINADAWKRFCEEKRLQDWRQLVPGFPADLLLDLCQENMPKVAPSVEELTALAREQGVEDPRPATVETSLASWRNAFEVHLESWSLQGKSQA